MEVEVNGKKINVSLSNFLLAKRFKPGSSEWSSFLIRATTSDRRHRGARNEVLPPVKDIPDEVYERNEERYK